MKRKKKIIIIVIILLVIGITTGYASTLINASDVIYDNTNSSANSNNVQGAIDELYSLASGNSCSIYGEDLINENMISYITNLAKSDTTNLTYDETDDKNLRYIGSDPNNYVLFNDEIWRIVGIMNNVTDSSGNSASRVKLIRAESIGSLAWNTSNAANWSNSSLQTILNSGDYYNRSNSYNSIGLSANSKLMITSVKWNLGGYTNHQISTSQIYTYERSVNVYSTNPTTWTGYVGLIYPSDYGYAVGNNNRSSCLSITLDKYTSYDCYLSNWIWMSNIDQFFLTPTLYNTAYYLNHGGNIGHEYTNVAMSIRPSVYLDTSILITKGEGTESNPYIISFEKEVQTVSYTSNISTPKLDDEGKLIPVILDDDGTVTYVRETNANWYNYDEKKWANAIILIDSPSKSYKVGDTILEADIESYFVWIPKYKYKLWNVETVSSGDSLKHTIDIVFDTEDTTDIEGVSCKTPMVSGESGNCDNGEYMTHPAFISLGVNGFWVGKFETGYSGATSTSGAQVSSSDSSKIIVKPNVYSWRSNTVYNMFLAAYNYERSLDSHMMKNTEWGAVAYLSHSKYGINDEVNINNNSSYKTGYSALPTTSQVTYPGTYGDGSSYNQAYNTETGYLASTTGNITGVYDMSGGNYEYVASYISGSLGSSGFSTTTIANYDSKYFDVYNSGSSDYTYQYRILGDSTGEMSPFSYYKDGDGTARYHSWYGDSPYFVYSSWPWFRRGGYIIYGVLAGLFDFTRYTGGANACMGSRIVLTG